MPITDLFSVRHENAHEFLKNVSRKNCEAFFGRFDYMVCDDIMESFPFIDNDYWSKEIYRRLVHELSYDLPCEKNNDRSIGQCREWFLANMDSNWRKPACRRFNLVELFFQRFEKAAEFASIPDEWDDSLVILRATLACPEGALRSR